MIINLNTDISIIKEFSNNKLTLDIDSKYLLAVTDFIIYDGIFKVGLIVNKKTLWLDKNDYFCFKNRIFVHIKENKLNSLKK
jgi:hypothetical protein